MIFNLLKRWASSPVYAAIAEMLVEEPDRWYISFQKPIRVYYGKESVVSIEYDEGRFGIYKIVSIKNRILESIGPFNFVDRLLISMALKEYERWFENQFLSDSEGVTF